MLIIIIIIIIISIIIIGFKGNKIHTTNIKLINFKENTFTRLNNMIKMFNIKILLVYTEQKLCYLP